eukprot:1611764-Amphidinium_carterae.1
MYARKSVAKAGRATRDKFLADTNLKKAIRCLLNQAQADGTTSTLYCAPSTAAIIRDAPVDPLYDTRVTDNTQQERLESLVEHRLKAPFQTAHASAVDSIKSEILAVAKGDWYAADSASAAVSAVVCRWLQLAPPSMPEADRASLEAHGKSLPDEQN